jgi:hypothetical protein
VIFFHKTSVHPEADGRFEQVPIPLDFFLQRISLENLKKNMVIGTDLGLML